jgi:hypothetical protein
MTSQPNDNREYWHELPQERIEELLGKGTTWGEVMENYRQPEWCTYPDALKGEFGCWSLTGGETRTKISHEYCNECDCYHKP